MLRYRAVSESDRTQLDNWISQDLDHKDTCNADFWLPDSQDEGIRKFVVADALGPIFFVRGENLLRLHIQFAPQSEKRRIALAIDEFTKTISAGAKKQKYKQLIFESVFEPLIQFLAKRGFRSSKNEQVYDIN